MGAVIITIVSMKSFTFVTLLVSIALARTDKISTKVSPSVKAPSPFLAPPVYADPPAYPFNHYPGPQHYGPLYGGYQQQGLAYGAAFQVPYQGQQLQAPYLGYHGLYGNNFYSP